MFLFARETFMPGLYLRRAAVTFTSFELLTKHRQRIQKFRENK